MALNGTPLAINITPRLSGGHSGSRPVWRSAHLRIALIKDAASGYSFVGGNGELRMPVISGFAALTDLPWERVTDKIERRVLAVSRQ